MIPASEDGARASYVDRLRARRQEGGGAERRHVLLSNLRLATALGGLALAWLALGSKVIPAAWLAVPIAGFAALAALHGRILRARDSARRAAAFYESGLARLEGRWIGTGVPGEPFAPPDHPYAVDLDLFGRGSLFELICLARTRSGEARLAAWLLSPAPVAEVRRRQQAVAELRPRIDLRERLALAGEEARSGMDSEGLLRWCAAPAAQGVSRFAGTAAVRTGLAGGAALSWALGWSGSGWLLLVLLTQAGFALRHRRRTREMIGAVERAGRDLRLLAGVTTVLERERFSDPLLLDLQRRLGTGSALASRRIRRLALLVELLDWRRNQVFAPLAAALLWTTHLALALERWRVRFGPSVSGWLEAVGEMEALSSLGSHAFEHPWDPFPDLVEDRVARFEAEGIGHPFLAEGCCVRNDLRLDGDLQLLVVSGSNMSGKTTLLRTVGVNVVLALAGAPVRATRLTLSALSPGACIRVHDSLQAGTSRFYAEITRLALLMRMAGGTPPLIFLLDEILHGTNSHDRRIGAEAVVRGLVDRGAIGLVTTHDLALASIADGLAGRAANVHFQDEIRDGKMTFDYRIHTGPVSRSNALELMRAVGLDV